jgi:hypothetical protein
MEQQLRGLEKHLHRIFVAGAILGALSCFARADYNLPLYAFLYIMWDQEMVSYDDGRQMTDCFDFIRMRNLS